MRFVMVLLLACTVSLAFTSPASARPPFAGKSADKPSVGTATAGTSTSNPSNTPVVIKKDKKSLAVPKIKGIRANPAMGSRQATALVQRSCADCKILSVNLLSAEDSQTYRVKTLSSQGVIKYIFVDGNSGKVFD